MTKNIKLFATLFAGLLPSGHPKNALLNRLGHVVGSDCAVGMCLLWRVDRLQLARGARVRDFNVFRDMKLVRLKEGASVGSWNWVSAAPEFRECSSYSATLVLGKESSLTSRHYVDCSGGVIVGDFAIVGGHRSTLLSHGIDFVSNSQQSGLIRIGNWTFISTGCTLLKGSVVPDRSVLAAGAVLTESRIAAEPGGLFGGVPAKRIKDIEGAYFSRNRGFVQ